MQIIQLNEQEWLASIDRLDNYSFFVSPLWNRILNHAGMGVSAQGLLYRFSDGEILLPVVRKRNRLGFMVTQSMIYGTYGGPLVIHPSPASPAWSRPIRESFQKEFLFGELSASPGPYPHLPLAENPIPSSTQCLDLTPGLDAIWKSMDGNTRSRIRQAEKSNLVITTDNSTQAFSDYYQMLCSSATRWGLADPGKPWSLFESIAKNGDEKSVSLWLAHQEDVLVAGILCFYGKGEVFYWSGAMYKEFSASRPNNLLFWWVIKDAIQRGFCTFNMGSSNDLDGVRRFKAGFGSKPVAYSSYRIQSPLYQALNRFKQSAIKNTSFLKR